MEPVTYQQNISKNELFHLMKAFGLPLGVLFLSLLTISAFGPLGSVLFSPLIALMWLTGVATATYLPQMREEVLNQTCAFIAGYEAVMIGIGRLLIGITSGVSVEMISSALNVNMPSSNNVILGYLPIMFQTLAIMTPIGFIAMQGRRIMQFRRTRSISKEFGRTRGIRNSGRTHDEIM